ncbi:MAG: FtsW/RodA/SpoVE family cell cycle protein, partial [Clostridia bacterium]|nr:FtsW/RodA/SpoVE family cell cycle protein [Clostridia bacterium]
LFGQGLGQSIQKTSFLPEPYNDFIFAVICEELGLLGAILVIALFVALILRGIMIAINAPDTFSSLTVFGIMSHIAIQTLFNICVVACIIPNTGITLPFFSYGGTALIVLMAEMGIVLNISRYSRKRL